MEIEIVDTDEKACFKGLSIYYSFITFSRCHSLSYDLYKAVWAYCT